MAASIFSDNELQRKFDSEGYVCMPLLGQDSVDQLRDFFAQIQPSKPGHGFYSTTFSPDSGLKSKIFEAAQKHFLPVLSPHFTNWKPLGASYLLKQPGQSGAMPIHQDWTATDETKWRTMTVWVPLEDVNAENGAIKVLPRSHNWSNALRGPTLPVIWREVIPQLEPHMKSLPMKAGEAFIFDHALLHSSHLNQSQEPRLAITFGFTQADAQLCHYFKDSQDTDPQRVERFSVPDDFFLSHHQVTQRPAVGMSTGFVRQDFSLVSKSECEDLLAGKIDGIYRPIQDLNLVKTMPKTRSGGFWKKIFGG